MDASRYESFAVDAVNVRNVIDAFRLFPDVGLRFFARRGLGRMDARGKLTLEARDTYPLAPWLKAFHEISARVGPSKMFEIGRMVPKNSRFPPHVRDIHAALRSLDVAYHMNHFHLGRPMFDPATGRTLDGIGHYVVVDEGPTRILVTSDDVPYPCELDRGICTTLATNFEPNATVVHERGRECRRSGGSRCVYVVAW